MFYFYKDQKTTLVSVKLNETTLIELEAEIYSYVVPSFFLKRKDKPDKAQDGRLLMIPFYKKVYLLSNKLSNIFSNKYYIIQL